MDEFALIQYESSAFQSDSEAMTAMDSLTTVDSNHDQKQTIRSM
jgi:hypothetical protein